MAWTDPKTWTPGPLSSGEMNEQVRDNLQYLYDRSTTTLKRVMRLNANQLITSTARVAADQWLAYSANSDDGSLFSYGAGIFTCEQAGNYQILASFQLAGGGSGYWDAAIDVNSSAVVSRRVHQQSNFQSALVMADLVFSVGDTVKFMINNQTGGDRNLYGSSSSADRGVMSMRYDGPAS